MRSLRRILATVPSSRRAVAILSVAAAFSVTPATARGDGTIFVANFGSPGTLGEFTTSGATVNASLVSGLDFPSGIAVSGSNLFVAANPAIGEYTTSGARVNASLISGLGGNQAQAVAVSGSDLFVLSWSVGTNGVIGEYTTSGATVNASLITGLSHSLGFVVSGSNIFVADFANGRISEYTTSGATVNASLISGLGQSIPIAIAVSGSNLFVVNGPGTIGEYTTSGATVNASLITGLNTPRAIAVFGSDLFIADSNNGDSIGEYTTSGATVNASLITFPNVNTPAAITVVPVPEPTTGLLVMVGALGLAVRRRAGVSA